VSMIRVRVLDSPPQSEMVAWKELLMDFAMALSSGPPGLVLSERLSHPHLSMVHPVGGGEMEDHV